MSDSVYLEPPALRVPILVSEQDGFRRTKEPITVGIPLPIETVREASELLLLDPDGSPHPCQIQVLARWFDGSIKWALLDFQADVEPRHTVEYLLRDIRTPIDITQPTGIIMKEGSDCIEVDTGQVTFVLDTRVLKPFSRIITSGVEVLDSSKTAIRLIDEDDREYQPYISGTTAETRGSLRTTLRFDGTMCDGIGRRFADFVSRISFFAGSSTVDVKLTLRNSRAASHPDGLWDLGDEGSIYFKEFSMNVALKEARTGTLLCERPEQPPLDIDAARLTIYQDSSGGDRWNSSNHINRFGKIGSTFQGYRVTADGITVTSGLRANPTVSIGGENTHLSAAIEAFWQNFPKAIDVEGRMVRLALFPHQFGVSHELQGGEQKTHTVFLSFNAADDLHGAHSKLAAGAPPDWYARTCAVPYLSPQDLSAASETLERLQNIVDTAVRGENTFFDRREVIDEYGWRNFGDVYADHEAVGHKGNAPLVAHYNNQYDLIHGALIHFLRSSDRKWFQLADDLARHVIDIDIYHTSADRIAFNGGLFWHTQHYTDAATCTHRAYSKASVGPGNRHHSGGGPSSEHNYTTGLMEYYFLTGDPTAKETVRGLAEWVINMDECAGGLLGALDRRPRGLCSMTVSWDYHGPGRGCGNSINALLDAYALSRDDKYRTKAEELIRRSIHPKDDIESRNLTDVEHRWSYTVFLQTLGKYLDLKIEYKQIDYMCAYARASLLHYAGWMLAHEVPYTSVLDKVEIPTETWPAQDIRKSNVFRIAAKHSDGATRDKFLERSRFFFDRCVNDVLQFKTCILTRPVVLLMTNGFMHSYYLSNPLEAAPSPIQNYDFGLPGKFKQQFYELYRLREQVQEMKELGIGLAQQL